MFILHRWHWLKNWKRIVLIFSIFPIFTISKLGCSPGVLAHTAKWAVHHHELSQSVNTHRCWVSTLAALSNITDMIWINDCLSFSSHLHGRKTTTNKIRHIEERNFSFRNLRWSFFAINAISSYFHLFFPYTVIGCSNAFKVIISKIYDNT